MIWLWDQGHNTVILRDAPDSTSDWLHVIFPGGGQIADPKDGAFKNGQITWLMEGPKTPPLNGLRRKARHCMEESTPAPYGSPNWKRNPFHSTRPNKNPNYTNCVEYPAYFGYLLGDHRFPRGYPPTTTKGWTDADGQRQPLPGDVFILCKTAQRDNSTAHVGVIYSTAWKGSGGHLEDGVLGAGRWMGRSLGGAHL